MVEFDNEPRFLDPWRCAECKGLMYNLDDRGRPSPGAPIGLVVTINEERKRVCSVCADMYIVVNESRYMVEQHMAWEKEQSRRREKLGVKGKYLDSNN